MRFLGTTWFSVQTMEVFGLPICIVLRLRAAAVAVRKIILLDGALAGTNRMEDDIHKRLYTDVFANDYLTFTLRHWV